MVSPTSLHNPELLKCREQIQEELLTFLDDSPETIKDQVCQIVVHNIKKLENNLDKQGFMSYNEFCRKLGATIMLGGKQ